MRLTRDHRSIVVVCVGLLTLAGWSRIAVSDRMTVQGRPNEPAGFVDDLTAAALERTTHHVRYDGRYRRIPYPGGDVPDGIGVCTDLVVRSYRALGIDLQNRARVRSTAVTTSQSRNCGPGTHVVLDRVI